MPASEDAILVDVVTEDGRKTFSIFEARDPPYQLRHNDIPWAAGFSNSIPSMRLQYRARIIPDIVRNLGHAFHTWLLVVLVFNNLIYRPNESRYEPPMVIYPFRFSSIRSELTLLWSSFAQAGFLLICTMCISILLSTCLPSGTDKTR